MKLSRLCAIIFSILFIFSIFPAICDAEDGIKEVKEIKVIINGKNITFGDVIISSKGRTLLPLRAVLTYLGVQNDDQHIIWNNIEKSVMIIKDSIKVKLIQGNDTAYLNDNPIKLDVPLAVYSKNRRTYVPARFVAQSLGKIVKWDNDTKSVIINDPKLVKVSTADELVKAIDSDTVIILKKGVYNLSKINQEYSGKNVFWESVYDGNQLIIKGVNNLTLEGEGGQPAEIIVEPRYADVLSFRDCVNINIKNVKAGHTPEKGECAGGVLTFETSSNISIINSELYGCGIEGLTLSDSNNLNFANSTIYNCNTAIMTLTNSKDISFYKSKFFDNEGYSYAVAAWDNCSLFFDDCDFTNNLINDGFLFRMNLSRITVKNSRIVHNLYPALASDTEALTMDNTRTEDNVTGNVSWDETLRLYNTGKYEDAIKCIDVFIAFNPEKYDAYTLKGDALYFLGKYEEAIQCYDRLLKVAGQATAYLYYSKGAAFYQIGKYDDSITCYDEALKNDPEYIDALNNKGDSLSNLGRFDEAIECYNRVFKLDSEDINARCGKANIWFYKGQYEEAIKEYDELITLQPDFITPYNSKGVALYRLGKNEEAIACYDKVINDLDTNNANAYYFKAQALVKLNRFSDSVENLKKSIELFAPNKGYAINDPAFDALKNRDDFKELTDIP